MYFRKRKDIHVLFCLSLFAAVPSAQADESESRSAVQSLSAPQKVLDSSVSDRGGAGGGGGGHSSGGGGHSGGGGSNHPGGGGSNHPGGGGSNHPGGGGSNHPGGGGSNHPGGGGSNHPGGGGSNHPGGGGSSGSHSHSLPRGGEVHHHEDGSRTYVHADGSQKVIGHNGRVTYLDHQGRVTAEVHGGTRITHFNDGSRSVVSGNQSYRESFRIVNNQQMMMRNYSYGTHLLNYPHSLLFEGRFGRFGCGYWRGPLWFYSTGLALGGLNYGFFGAGWGSPYQPIWGYNYWNAYPWGSYGWYQYYSGWYWRPYGYWAASYRPSYALVDWILALNLEYAWSERIAAAREAARQDNENRAAEAESEVEAAFILSQADAEMNQAATNAETDGRAASDAAQAAANAAGNASQATQVDRVTQDQLASQVEQVARERQDATPINTAFENALRDDKHLYLVNASSDKQYDQGNGSVCGLQIGDILQRDQLMGDSGLVSLRVKVSQPGSCPSGGTITMTTEDLANIYNSFQQQMDLGAQQLANKNQPH